VRRKKLAIIAIQLFFLFALRLQADPSPPASITWSIVYQNEAGSIFPIDFETLSTKLSQSDRLKIFLKHDAEVYAYLFLHDTEENLYLLYPRSFADFEDKAARSAFIPEGLQWFEFAEGSGTERLYLFASTKRLKALEEATRSYARAASGANDGERARVEARGRTLEEMRRLQLENFEIAKRAKGEIIVAAGEFRGLQENFEFPAEKASFDGFYFRTIRISH
jgi:hypothetical protein